MNRRIATTSAGWALLAVLTVSGMAHAEGRGPRGRGPRMPDVPVLNTYPTLTQAAAELIVEAARQKATQTDSGVYKAKTKMHVYVLGREGTLLAGTQKLGAWPGSADIAMKKARTAWLFKLPTRTIGELSRSDKANGAPLYGIEHSNGGLISFPGGLPIFDAGGELVGSIGVSGDTVDNDELVAQAGVDKAKELGVRGIKWVPTLSGFHAGQVVMNALRACAETDSGVYKGQKVKMHVYVLGVEGTLLASAQQDGAWPGSADIAQRKARTSWLFKLPTGTVGELSRQDKKNGAPLYGIEHSNTGLITFPGGLPLFDLEGHFVGSIGVSGDTVDKDHAIATAGAEALKRALEIEAKREDIQAARKAEAQKRAEEAKKAEEAAKAEELKRAEEAKKAAEAKTEEPKTTTEEKDPLESLIEAGAKKLKEALEKENEE